MHFSKRPAEQVIFSPKSFGDLGFSNQNHETSGLNRPYKGPLREASQDVYILFVPYFSLDVADTLLACHSCGCLLSLWCAWNTCSILLWEAAFHLYGFYFPQHSRRLFASEDPKQKNQPVGLVINADTPGFDALRALGRLRRPSPEPFHSHKCRSKQKTNPLGWFFVWR